MPESGSLNIRPMVRSDLPQVGPLAAGLVEFHHKIDSARFFTVPNVAAGYQRWFTEELQNPKAILLVACMGETLVGYAYGTLEARDWAMLLDAHAVLHDIYIADTAREHGAGDALVAAFVKACQGKEVEKVVLYTAKDNVSAQRVFERQGFRPTMVEMMLELAPKSDR